MLSSAIPSRNLWLRSCGMGGVEPDAFEARRLSEQMLKEADLILSMTRAQRGLGVEVWPLAVRRAFTLREFARLLSCVDPSALPKGAPAERLRAAIPLAVAQRSREQAPPDEDDICGSVSPQRRGVCQLV